MEENQMLEKIWSEAQRLEVPPELSPERMKERIEAEAKTAAVKNTKNKSEKRQEKKRNKFRWKGFGGRVAAAAVVLAVSLGVYGVASSQPLAPEPTPEQGGEMDAAMETQIAASNVSESDVQADEEVSSDAAEEPVVRELGDYYLAENYEDVYEMLAAYAEMNGILLSAAAADTDGIRVEDLQKEAAMEAAEQDMASASSFASADTANTVESAAAKDYSTTNLQVTGVDESDIVKTDGHYIYIATDDQVQIVDASTDEPRQLGSIKPEFSGNMDRIREMYVADGKLLLIVQVEDTDEPNIADGEDGDMMQSKFAACDEIVSYDFGKIHTQVLTYDITSPAGAKLLGTFEQDGSYESSRKIGDQLYLFTDYGVYGNSLYRYGQTEEVSDDIQLPQIQGQTIPEDCIYLPKDASNTGILIAAMDINEPEKATDQKMIFNGSAQMYVTGNSIYLYQVKYNSADDRMRTSLTRFQIGDGRITADCAEAVPGYLEDTFAIHESGDGYLYVLTTSSERESTNQIYVLDEKLKIYGKIEDIAVGETVYAARFIDDIGYFVTYRNMDPLFTVDFSDPANPTLIGELEIPGFSDYLQFWDDEHLIGVGEERKAEDSEFIGIKVSLYDISDPTNVTESSKIVIEDASYASASHNYKTLLADSKKNIVAFLTEDKGADAGVSQRVFTVEDGRLVEACSDQLARESGETYYGSADYRNLYIGDRLYLVREGLVIVYDMSDGFKRTATLKLT